MGNRCSLLGWWEQTPPPLWAPGWNHLLHCKRPNHSPKDLTSKKHLAGAKPGVQRSDSVTAVLPTANGEARMSPNRTGWRPDTCSGLQAAGPRPLRARKQRDPKCAVRGKQHGAERGPLRRPRGSRTQAEGRRGLAGKGAPEH